MLSNRRIRQLADRGDRKRLEAYIRENSRKANDRMRNIERKRPGRTGAVYDVAKETLRGMNRKRYGANLSKLSIDDLEKQALSLNNYLRSQTSTVRGIEQRERRILNSLKKRGYDIKNPELFFEILQSDMISQYADIDSDEVMQSATMWANSNDYDVLEAISKAEEQYRTNSDIYIDDAFKLIEEYNE